MGLFKGLKLKGKKRDIEEPRPLEASSAAQENAPAGAGLSAGADRPLAPGLPAGQERPVALAPARPAARPAGLPAGAEVPEIQGAPVIVEGFEEPEVKKKKGLGWFKKDKKAKKSKKEKAVVKEEPKADEEMVSDSYVEKLFTVPYLQCIPVEWCREYLVGRVAKQIASQTRQVFYILVFIFVLFAGVTLATHLFSGYIGRHTGLQLAGVKRVLDGYKNEIKSAVSLGGVLNFVHEVPMREQYKGVVKVMAEAGIVVHGISFNHSYNEVPNNVKSNFEAQGAVKFDDIKLAGCWYVDGSYMGGESKGAREGWINGINKKVKQIYSGYNTNVYVDTANQKYSARDNVNRAEIIIVFWN